MATDDVEDNEKLSSMDNIEETKISQYTLLEKIEAGDYCDTYLAQTEDDSEPVNLVILQACHVSNRDLKDRFLSKARAVASLNHPGLAHIHEISEHNQRPFVVHDNPKERRLREIIRSGELALPQILDIVIGVAEALSDMHRIDLVNEDIRPRRISIDADQAVRICGFDWIGIKGGVTDAVTRKLTSRLGYLSPEQIQGRPIDQRSDIFSLGVVLYEMLTCRHPFSKAGQSATIKAVLEASPEPASHIAIDMPDGLEAIVNKALAGEPAKRYLDTNELLTDLKAQRTQESLRENEQLYGSLIERANDGICIIQDEFLIFLNRQLAAMLGQKTDEVLGHPFGDFVPPEEISTVKRNYSRHMAGQEFPLLYESALQDKSGQRVAVEISAGRIVYEGRPAIMAIIRDITKRKLAEKAVRNSEIRYRDLFENMLEGAYQTLPDGTILTVNKAMVEMLGYDTKEELYTAVRAQDIYADPDDRKILTKKLEKDSELRNVEFRLKRKDGRILTVMENARAIRDENNDILHYEGLLTDITNRKKAEAELRSLSSIVKQSIEGIALVDTEGNIQFINVAFAEMHGYTPEELAGKNLNIFHNEKQLEAVNAANKQILNTGQFSGEIWHVHRDGTEFPTLMHNSLHYDAQGNPIGIIGTARDTTDLKAAEEALRESRAMLQSIFRSAPVGIGLVSHRILEWTNEKLSELTGYSSEEMVGQSARLLYPSDEEFERVGRVKYALIEKFGTGSIETQWQRKDGTIIDVLLSSTPIEPDNFTTSVTFSAMDITERKRSEEKLREAHEQLNATLNALPDLFFEVDRHGRILDYRAPKPELLYTSPDKFLGKKMDKIMPHEAAEIIQGALWEAIDTGQSAGVVYSLEMKDKKFWFELSIAAKGDSKAPDARFVMLVRDVTERHEGEVILRKTTEELGLERKSLTEKNIALEQILEHIEKQRRTYQQQVLNDMEKAILPQIRSLKRHADAAFAAEIETLESNLQAVLTKDRKEFEARYAKLTSRESEICEMIKTGLSTKQISDDLSLSQLTVQKHREQIRKKLGITNTSINLATYLRTR